MFKCIDKSEFEENKNKNKYKYCFGECESGGSKIYESKLSNTLNVALVSNGGLSPKINLCNGLYILLVDNHIYIIGIEDEEFKKSFDLKSFVYDVVDYNKKLIIIGEIDIVVVGYDFNILEKVELNDILSNYFIRDGILYYSTMEGVAENEIVLD